MYVLSICVCTTHMHVRPSLEQKICLGFPGAALWVTGTEPTSQAGTIGALNPPRHLFSSNVDL